MKSYLTSAMSTKKTPQSEAIPGSSQVENSAGGYSWQVDKWTQLERFLILGSEGGTYYISEQKLTKDNAKSVLACLKEDGKKTLEIVIGVSQQGRAPKNDTALFCMAMAISFGDLEIRRLAASYLPNVARTSTHLFDFVSYAVEMRGWGRLLKSAVKLWYAVKANHTEKLAYQLVKYPQRNGWSHRDLLRLTHGRPNSLTEQRLFNWVVQKEGPTASEIPLLDAAFRAKSATEKETIKLILEHNLPRECVNTDYLKSPKIWDALLQSMPLTAMIRNLGNMSSIGLLTPNSDAAIEVHDRLANCNMLKKARIHPLNVYLALITYRQGHGTKGGNSWNPVPTISAALEKAFYKSFDFVKPTNKRWLLGLDVSGSMADSITNMPLSCRDASALLAMVTLRTEPFCFVGGFTSGSYPSKWGSRYSSGFSPLSITKNQNLEQAVKTINNLPFGGTDCALPMIYARENKIPVDCFVVYTDNETWAGSIHPKQALDMYRQSTGIAAKSVVVSMLANKFSIADPSDAGMMDVAGFDTTVPTVLSSFVGGSSEQEDTDD